MTFQQYRTKLIKLGKLIHRAYWEGRINAMERLTDYRSNFMDQYPEYDLEN